MRKKTGKIRKGDKPEPAFGRPGSDLVKKRVRVVDRLRILQRRKGKSRPLSGLGYAHPGNGVQHLAKLKSL